MVDMHSVGGHYFDLHVRSFMIQERGLILYSTCTSLKFIYFCNFENIIADNFEKKKTLKKN